MKTIYGIVRKSLPLMLSMFILVAMSLPVFAYIPGGVVISINSEQLDYNEARVDVALHILWTTSPREGIFFELIFPSDVLTFDSATAHTGDNWFWGMEPTYWDGAVEGVAERGNAALPMGDNLVFATFHFDIIGNPADGRVVSSNDFTFNLMDGYGAGFQADYSNAGFVVGGGTGYTPNYATGLSRGVPATDARTIPATLTETFRVDLTRADADEPISNLDGWNVVWTSSDDAVVTVTGAGAIVAGADPLAAPTSSVVIGAVGAPATAATVTAQLRDGDTNVGDAISWTVTVGAAPAFDGLIDPGTATLANNGFMMRTVRLVQNTGVPVDEAPYFAGDLEGLELTIQTLRSADAVTNWTIVPARAAGGAAGMRFLHSPGVSSNDLLTVGVSGGLPSFIAPGGAGYWIDLAVIRGAALNPPGTGLLTS